VSDISADQADRGANESAKNASKNPKCEQLDQRHLDTRKSGTCTDSDRADFERRALG